MSAIDYAYCLAWASRIWLVVSLNDLMMPLPAGERSLCKALIAYIFVLKVAHVKEVPSTVTPVIARNARNLRLDRYYITLQHPSGPRRLRARVV